MQYKVLLFFILFFNFSFKLLIVNYLLLCIFWYFFNYFIIW
jgi:hypothetical protein